MDECSECPVGEAQAPKPLATWPFWPEGRAPPGLIVGRPIRVRLVFFGDPLLALLAIGNRKLGPPVVPFLTLFLGEGSPTKIDYRKKLVPNYSNLSNLEDRKGHQP